jgi:Sensors of blue-light using FAD
VSQDDVSTGPTTSGLRQVLYLSRAAGEVTDVEVRRILFASRRNNRRRDITGCLLFSGRHFVQVLEGEREVLSDLIAHIGADPRHDNVQVVVDQEVRIRRYPNWSMGILYKLEVADRIEAILAGAACPPDIAFGLMSDVNPDSVMGALS